MPHPDVFDQDAAWLVAPPIEALREDAAVDFVDMTPLVERMRSAFFTN
jgi:hypothetical protein